MPAFVTTLDLGVFGFLCVWGVLTFRLVRRARYHCPGAVGRPASPAQRSSTFGAFSATDVFDRRKGQLDDDKRRLERNIALLATMLAVAICMAVGAANRTDMSLMGVQVPFNALVLLVPAMLLYLWGRFGFLLHQSIENRYSLIRVLEEMESVGEGRHWSLEPLLRDHGFVDSYIYWDRQAEGQAECSRPGHCEDHPEQTAGSEQIQDTKKPERDGATKGADDPLDEHKDYIPLFAYLFFMASVHAAIFGTLWNGIVAWEGTVGGYLTRGCLVLFAVLISYTHYKFASYRRARHLQCGVIIAAVLLTPVFPLLANA